MGQRSSSGRFRVSLLVGAMVLLTLGGCDGRKDEPATRPVGVTVASLSPAATDLLIGMGARDRLVGVSQYDKDRPDVSGLPLVGDYLSMDWEQLAAIRPAAMIVQIAPERMPKGLAEKAESLGIRLVNIRIDTLNDVFTALETLGKAVDEPQKAADTAGQIRRRLDAVRQRVAQRPRVRTLITIDEKAEGVVGRNTFLNDLLELAGGENVIEARHGAYPRIDRELLAALRPDAVLQLVLDNNEAGRRSKELQKQQARLRQEARELWRGLPDLPAVQNDRVYILSDWYILLPGYHVADVAEHFAQCLHPVAGATSGPATAPAGGKDAAP